MPGFLYLCDRMDPVDLTKVLASKSPRLAHRTPRFVIRWLERLVHLPQINEVLTTYGDQPPMEFIRSTLGYIGLSYTVHGAENIPAGGRAIFASNHPLGGLDGMALALGVHESLEAQGVRSPEVKVIVNDLLMNLRPLEPIFVPVNKHGGQKADYARQMAVLYESDAAIITFPAGLCSRLTKGEITDPPWHRNFAAKAWATGRPVVPVFVSGRNSMRFYRLARWRKRLGIRANLEMITLPREMFAQKDKHLDICFGRPVEITNEHPPRWWASGIRKQAYALDPAAGSGKTKK